MDIDRYQELLGITVPETQRPTIAARLTAASVHVNQKCGGQFMIPDGIGGVKISFPPDVELGVAKLAQAMADAGNVASYSIEGMSKSFFQGGGYVSASAYWQPYIVRKLRFI